MIKVSNVYDFNWNVEPVQLIPVSRKGVDKGFFKAAGSYLDQTRDNLKPVDGHTPVFVLAMGAGEYTASNRNADYWPGQKTKIPIFKPAGQSKVANIEAGLKERAWTFEKYGKVYKNHNNSDPKLAKGDIYSASYNPNMGRVESVVLLNNKEFPNEINKLASGKHVPFSMSAKVPFDFCNFCGNKAKTRSEYCEHLKKHANAITEEGLQIVAINEKPTFFDLSVVDRNADRIGYGLAKVACTGADLAEALDLKFPEGLLRKTASDDAVKKLDLVKKLGKIEKTIEAEGCPTRLTRAVVKKEVPEDILVIMRAADPGILFKELKKNKVLLPAESFNKLFLGDIKDKAKEIDRAVRGIFSKIQDKDVDSFINDNTYEPIEGLLAATELKRAVQSLKPDFSLDRPAVTQRIIVSVSKGSYPKIKEAGVGLNPLAVEYAKYQLSMLKDASEDEKFLAILSNYC